jgi:uncharacterized protein (TIGR03437 family)
MKSLSAFLTMALAAVCAFGQSSTPVFTTGQAARLVIGQQSFTAGNFGATNTLIGSPYGVALGNGVLWVVDANREGASPTNNRVLRFSDVSTFPGPTQSPYVQGSTCGACRGVSSLVLGQPDFTTNNSTLSQTGLRGPTGVATDGNILALADTDNNRVLIWLRLPTRNGQPADVVVGQPDFTHNATAVPPTQTSLRGPEGVWIWNGKLFIADTQDNRVLIYNKIPTSNNARADLVVGQPNFTSFVQPDLTQTQPSTAANNMQDPIAVSTDGTRLFVTDFGQNRVLIFNSIPTSNGASANVAIGQPDLVSSINNNSFSIPANATLDADSNPEGATPVLCQSTGTDSDGTVTFPTRCAKTLEYPRFAISDGTRLFIADGGNDRVLVYNTIPTQSGAAADVILGQPDEFSDDDGENPDGTNAFQTPAALSWDGTNLYVSDTFNRRVVIYSMGIPNVPLDGIRNAASLEIYALGTIDIAGTITAKDTASVTIDSATYTYTVTANDTLLSVMQGLATKINTNPGDPNVIANVNTTTAEIVLTARTPGTAGGNITYSVTTSANATITLTTGGANLNIYLENPSQIAPGTLIQISGNNLCDNTASGDFSQSYLPFTLGGCTVFIDGMEAPLLYVSPTQINAQMPYETLDRTSTSLLIQTQHADTSVTATTPVAVTIVPQNPGLFALAGNDPRPGLVYHASSFATDMVDVDGTIQAGDTGSITIASPNGSSATYSYNVGSSDTLQSVRDGLIQAINNAPDPYVHASAGNEFARVVITANQPGAAGENIAVTENVTSTVTAGADLLLTVYNPVTCCSNIAGAPVTVDNPAVGGEMVYTLSTGIGPTVTDNVGTGQVLNYEDNDGPAVNVDSILTSGTTANVVNVTLLPGSVGVWTVVFQLNSGLAANPLTQLTIAQQAFVSNVVTFPVAAAPSYLTNATASSTSATAASSAPPRRSVISVPARRGLAGPKSETGAVSRGTSPASLSRSPL